MVFFSQTFSHKQAENGAADENEQIEEVVAEVARGAAVIKCLKEHARTTQSASAIQGLSRSLGIAYSTSLRYLQSCAEACHQGQINNLNEIVRHLYAVRGNLDPIVLVMKYAYDETPLRCKIQTEADDSAESMVIGKIYVIEVSWKVAVQINAEDTKKTLFLGGHFSPMLRPLERNSGRNIAAMLRQVPGAPPLAHDLFPMVLRAVETDEANQNSKAERDLASAQQPLAGLRWHFVCLGHKIHQIASSAWSLEKSTMSGIIHLMLALFHTSNLVQLTENLCQVVERTTQIVEYGSAAFDPLTESAKQYRANIIRNFLPSKPKQRATMLLFASLYNVDWRQGPVTHICRGCCADHKHTISKMVVAMRKVVKVLRPTRVCKANWLEWHAPLSFVALLGHCHNLLKTAFQTSFCMSLPPVEEES